jgi:hypothetical protein
MVSLFHTAFPDLVGLARSGIFTDAKRQAGNSDQQVEVAELVGHGELLAKNRHGVCPGLRIDGSIAVHHQFVPGIVRLRQCVE